MSVRQEIERRAQGDQPPPLSRPIAHRKSSILVGQRSLEIIEETGQKEPTFVVFIIKWYKKWGFIIANHAWAAILICLAISSIATVKIFFTPQKNDITGYAPFEARSRVEYRQYTSFFSHDGLAIATYIFVTARDGGTLLRDDYLKEAVQVLDVASNNITIFNSDANQNQSFNQFCINFCQVNEPVRQFYNGLIIQRSSLAKGDGLNERLKLEYPVSFLFGRSVSLQPNFFGVELYNDTEEAFVKKSEDIFEEEIKSNHTEIISAVNEMPVSNMKMVKLISLQFRAEHLPSWTDDDVKDWEIRVTKFFQDTYKSDRLKIYVMSQTYVEEEMVRAGISLLPYLIVGFFIMCTCSIVSVLVRAAYMHQSNIYKIILAVMACITPLMACSTALSIMFLVGVRFSSLLCVIPFLVLSIGVDSSYLMIHEWQRVTKEIREKKIKKDDSVGHRMSEVLCEVGPAILISAITNILADAVGCWTSSPEIRLLCIGNLLSMFIAYIYQMTFYSGLMVVVGKFEIDAERVKRNKTEIAINETRVNISHDGLTRKSSRFHDTSKLYISKYMRIYVDFVTDVFISSLTIIIYFVYIAFSIWGITRVNINLTPQKLFALDSPLLELDHYRVRYQVPVFTQATVFVNSPGNLSEKSHLNLMNTMVKDFENITGSWGPIGTMYFVRDFMQFETALEFEEEEYDYDPEEPHKKKQSDGSKFNNNDLQTFLVWPEYDFWTGFIQLENETEDGSKKNLSRFFFTTGYHGDNLKIWTERGALLRRWRKVIDKPEYKSFEASVFHEDGIFLDLIDNMPTDTWQSVLGTLICMAAVCFVFLRSTLTVAIATSCVLSICIGILGILSWWGIDLDPITMAAMIISIGFSVDIPAHVSYHYYKACESGPNASPQERLGNCLSSVAFPALQAALSTILCVCSLLFVKIYMSEVFVKTMTLCVLLCNIHGLVFLPAILSMVDRINAKCQRKKTYDITHKSNQKKIRQNLAAFRANNKELENVDRTKVDRPPLDND